VSEDGATAGRLIRRFTLGSGLLKRGSDRVQFAARVLLLILLVTAAPVALAVAGATGSQTRSLANAQAAARHQVGATLLADAPPAGDAAHPELRSAVRASWTTPSGVEREGIVDVREDTKAGTTVSIWVDRAGNETTRPLGTADVVSRAIGYGVATFLGISTLATVSYLAVRVLLDRHRLRRWAADWAVVEPVWSRKVP
jgi:hypothetical protein